MFTYLVVAAITLNAILVVGWGVIIIWLMVRTNLHALVTFSVLLCLGAGCMVYCDFYFDPKNSVVKFDVSYEVYAFLLVSVYWIFGMKY